MVKRISISQRLLRFPLLGKLIGANSIIVFVALVVVLASARLSDELAILLVVTLALSAVVNFFLVRIALWPVDDLKEVAARVAAGEFSARVPESEFSDRAILRVARTMNEMLDRVSSDRDRMRKMGAEVVYAQELERSRLAHDLHDSIAQTIAASVFQLAAIERDTDPKLAERLADLRQQLRTALEEIREMSQSLHPRETEDLGLATALESLARKVRERSLIDVGITIEGDSLPIPRPLAATLYRVVEEALRNVEKHAEASSAQIILRSRKGAVEVEVVDDGCGFDEVKKIPSRANGGGLREVRERVSLAGGEITVDSRRGRGTRVSARVGTDAGAA
jgi:signal transduction histidine kinase